MSEPFPLGLESPGSRLGSTPVNRSPERLMAIVAEHLCRGRYRYEPRDVTGDGRPETFCNVLVQDVTEAMGCPVPRHTRANELLEWLSSSGRSLGWTEVSESVARIQADRGSVALAAWRNPDGPGHLAIVVPSLGERGDTFIAQAGATNFTRRPLAAGFGRHQPRFFAHQ